MELRSSQKNSRTVLLAAIARGVLGLSGLDVLRLRVHPVPFVILVMVPYPRHPVLQPFFVAPLWRKVQPVVSPDVYGPPARVAQRGGEDLAAPVLEEPARAGPFLAREFLQAVVVIH